MARVTAARLPTPDSVLNDLVREFVPTEQEIYLTLPDGRYVNAIYAGVQLREHERTQLRLFHEWISTSKKEELPLGFSDGHHEELRFLNT